MTSRPFRLRYRLQDKDSKVYCSTCTCSEDDDLPIFSAVPLLICKPSTLSALNRLSTTPTKKIQGKNSKIGSSPLCKITIGPVLTQPAGDSQALNLSDIDQSPAMHIRVGKNCSKVVGHYIKDTASLPPSTTQKLPISGGILRPSKFGKCSYQNSSCISRLEKDRLTSRDVEEPRCQNYTSISVDPESKFALNPTSNLEDKSSLFSNIKSVPAKKVSFNKKKRVFLISNLPPARSLDQNARSQSDFSH